jgi:hypothetical protein
LADSGGEQQGSDARSGARAVFISYASQDKTTADAVRELGEVFLAEHRPLAALETMSKEPEELSRLICMPAALWSLGRQPEADALLGSAREKYQDSADYGVAYNYTVRGDKDEAFKWLDRAFDNHDLHMKFLNEDPTFHTLHSDPRYAALERKIEATKRDK